MAGPDLIGSNPLNKKTCPLGSSAIEVHVWSESNRTKYHPLVMLRLLTFIIDDMEKDSVQPCKLLVINASITRYNVSCYACSRTQEDSSMCVKFGMMGYSCSVCKSSTALVDSAASIFCIDESHADLPKGVPFAR